MTDLGGKGENWAVDQLLAAEEEANKIIKAAQQEKESTLKNARMAADKEIEQARKQAAAEFEEKQLKAFGKDNFAEELEKDTKEQLVKINQDYEANKDQVIAMLIERIIDVGLEIPRVVKENFKSQQPTTKSTIQK